MRIQIRWNDEEVTGVLDQTPTAKAVFEALPAKATANTWGEEVYFDLPVEAVLDSDARPVVEPGTICYWVQGRSLALPYGPTPASEGSECRLVTAVNVLGKLEGDPRILSHIQDGDTITVEQAEGQ